MLLPGFFVDMSALTADFDGMAAVALVGRHELDAAVAVLSVVPVDKAIHPGFYREQIPEPPQRITLVVFHGAEP